MSRKKLELIPADKIEVKIKNGEKLVFNRKDVIGFLQAEVTDFGNGAKINFSKDYFNNQVYVVVCK